MTMVESPRCSLYFTNNKDTNDNICIKNFNKKKYENNVFDTNFKIDRICKV
jgi:hypothetical protein